MMVHVSSTFRVGGDADLDALTDRLMDELLEIEEQTGLIHDSTVSATLASREVEVEVVVAGESLEDAQRLALRMIEQAIAGTGGSGSGNGGPVFAREKSEQELVTA